MAKQCRNSVAILTERLDHATNAVINQVLCIAIVICILYFYYHIICFSCDTITDTVVGR